MSKLNEVKRVTVWFNPNDIAPEQYACILMEVSYGEDENEIFYGYYNNGKWLGIMPLDKCCEYGMALEEISGDVVLWSYID